MQTQKQRFVPPVAPFSAWGVFFGLIILVIIGLLVAGVPEDIRGEEGFLDTDASLMSDLSLVAYVLLLVPAMVSGFVLAKNKKFVPYHQMVMTAIVIFNWALIGFIMAVTFEGLAENRSDNEGNFTLALIHFLIAISAQVLGTYLVLRMWLEPYLPGWAKVKKLKRYMRLTLAGWLIAAVLGAATYVRLYDLPGSGGSTIEEAPSVTPEPVDNSMQATETATPDATPEVNETPEIDDDDEDEDDDSGQGRGRGRGRGGDEDETPEADD